MAIWITFCLILSFSFLISRLGNRNQSILKGYFDEAASFFVYFPMLARYALRSLKHNLERFKAIKAVAAVNARRLAIRQCERIIFAVV